MKNLKSKASTGTRRKRNIQRETASTPRVHERGDKVVVNGAKESLLSILKRHICDCGKHTGDKLIQSFLKANKITASYDVIVWMFIFMKINCEDDLYDSIANEYLKKMEKKNKDEENHQSQRYKTSKKETLVKFIESAYLLITGSLDKKTIDNSVGALYSKGKSRDNALKKIDNYLEQIEFDGCLKFTQSKCSLRFKEKKSTESILAQQVLGQQRQTLPVTSDNSEGRIQNQALPLKGNTQEEGQRLEDYESMSYWFSESKETYDLFEELIQNNDLDCLRGSY